jgi:hypothetical protein
MRLGARPGRIGRSTFFSTGGVRVAARWSLGLPFLSAALAACAPRDPYPHAADLRLPRPTEPVTWKIYPENQPIASDLTLGSMMLLTSVVVLTAGGFLYRNLARRSLGAEGSGLSDFVASQA